MRLEGPLQSWGERSSWDTRDTALMPTKSGVIGLAAGCMGLARGDEGIDKLSQALHMAVRADKPGIVMTDYQTVQGMPYLNSANGKPRTANTIVSPRDYLQDASFLVALYGDSETIENVAKGIREPKWAPYLGRKNCVPATPIIPVLTEKYGTVESAFSEIKLFHGKESGTAVEAEIEETNGESVRYDNLKFALDRQFCTRNVKRMILIVEGDNDVFNLS
jgi:CRISPR system Cascade subunit CasD